MKISFSFDLRDSDGDVYEECLLLHCNDDVILKLKDIHELRGMIGQLNKIEKEIVENYPID